MYRNYIFKNVPYQLNVLYFYLKLWHVANFLFVNVLNLVDKETVETKETLSLSPLTILTFIVSHRLRLIFKILEKVEIFVWNILFCVEPLLSLYLHCCFAIPFRSLTV